MNGRSLLSTLAAPALATTFATILSLAALGCGASTPPPEDATNQNDSAPDDGASEPREATAEPPEPEPKPLSHGAKKITDEGAAADYTLTEKDCIELGKQYVAVQRADQIAGLDKRLTDKQREQAVKNIDAVVGKMGEPWANGCIESLVGKVAERKRLECAMAAKSVKAFDECLNGEDPPK
ncbi:hypothetical protein [Polyangium sp. 15x6]|uniref:hypothetical protein n=1 Tax=Polyangium sp. 15x6 TaxID=3042687 RepID=UPI00249B814E|nr:hypothetical protein [Polyangium sp. 15x6]MDI3287891.1 hypothetical protein [Polyangium sp. 15x6]